MNRYPPIQMSYTKIARISDFLSGLPRLRLPSTVIAAVKGKQPLMTKTHEAMPATLDNEYLPSLMIRKTPNDPEKMLAFVTDGKKTLFVFGRKGATNFAPSRKELAEGVYIECPEQFFKLLCASSHDMISENTEEVMLAILSALTPFAAKKAPYALTPFDAAAWDAQGMAAMKATIAFHCTNPETFARFKKFALIMGPGPKMVVEGNDDAIWGVNIMTEAYLKALTETHTKGADLFETANKISKGKNQLGIVLTEFLDAIYDLEYDEYMEQASKVQFIEIV